MNAERARWLLQHPLDNTAMPIDPYRETLPQAGGALLTAVLAVDR